MNLETGDKIVRTYERGGKIRYKHEYTVYQTDGAYVELENGDYLPISKIKDGIEAGIIEVNP